MDDYEEIVEQNHQLRKQLDQAIADLKDAKSALHGTKIVLLDKINTMRAFQRCDECFLDHVRDDNDNE